MVEGGNHKTRLDVWLEKVTPAISYFLILFPIIFSFISVEAVAIYLIIAYVFFLYKSVTTCVQFAIALRRIDSVDQINWVELLQGLEDPSSELEKLKIQINDIKKFSWESFQLEAKSIYSKLAKDNKIYVSNKIFPKFIQKYLFNREKKKALKFIKQEIKVLKSLNIENYYKPSELQHIIIIPHVKEPPVILRETLEKLKNQTINTKQINVVLAAEARDPNGVKVSEEIKAEFEQYFNNIWVTSHTIQPNEIVGKSSNMNWAGLEIYKIITKAGWDLEKTTITSCDADSKFDPQYFAYMSYKYCTTKNAKYKFYNGAMLFYNNIWRLPFYARVKNSFHSIFNTANLVRADKLVPFSTYTTSFWLIKEIDFWDPWITPEDYHLYFKALFKYNKEVSAIPLFIKIMSDAAEGDGHWKTISNNYKQSRRWAWGISDNGWMIKNLVKGLGTFHIRAIYKTLHVLFDHVMGLSISFLILLGGSVPGLINPDFKNNVAGVLFPIISGDIVKITLVFMIIVVVLDFYLMPRPDHYPWWKKIIRVFEWIVQPFASFFLTALPGMEAQTRLFFGKYMEYYVTQKKGVEEVKTEAGDSSK
jgi:hypothetical protein